MRCAAGCAGVRRRAIRGVLLAGLLAEPGLWVLSKRKCLKRLEARVGFEPTNGGFADLSLGPLGYRAELLSIAKLAQSLGVAASG